MSIIIIIFRIYLTDYYTAKIKLFYFIMEELEAAIIVLRKFRVRIKHEGLSYSKRILNFVEH